MKNSKSIQGMSLLEIMLTIAVTLVILFVLLAFSTRITGYFRKYQVRNQVETDARRLMSTLNSTLPLSNGQIVITCQMGFSASPNPPCGSLRFITTNSPLLPGASVQYTIGWNTGNQVSLSAYNLNPPPNVGFNQVLANNVTWLTFLLPDSRNTNIVDVSLSMSELTNPTDPASAVTYSIYGQRITLETHQ